MILQASYKRAMATMRTVRFLPLLCMTLLSACQRRAPDFSHSIVSPGGEYQAIVRGYQPRGTISGSISFFIRRTGSPKEFRVARIARGRELSSGWISARQFVIVGSRVSYNEMQSEVFPNGNYEDRVSIAVCENEIFYCKNISGRSDRKLSWSLSSFPDQ